MAIRTFRGLERAVYAAFRAIGLRPNEQLVSNEDQYDSFIRVFGREPSASELWNRAACRPGGMCYCGEIGHMAADYAAMAARLNVRAGTRGLRRAELYALSHRAATEVLQHFRGRISYLVDNIIYEIWSLRKDLGQRLTRRLVERIVRFNMAHERRHEVQPVTMFDWSPFNEIGDKSYLALRHEADADAFAMACARGTADVNDPASWEPERML